ncbi:sce7726 family protein [Adlercreutzia equolifaciens]|uniref:sce7726 family protein n=1 Tax=Adlercreutzia equolifaciens TaxID=446660 RepID=UPI0023B081DE|nr:sce7726 family protein [Adlercreutzia equolifaciens]MDE8702830.1 sce7726 family protein [Adlercreutzia equolifaciens]
MSEIMLSSKTELQHLFANYSTLKTSNVLEQLLEECCVDTKGRNPREVINDLYFDLYPNETVVKASFVQKALPLKKANSVYAFEVPAGNSRADVCRIGRLSTAYEIKTEYDSFTRLETQLRDYLSIFDLCYLVVPRAQLTKAVNLSPPTCGIITYTHHRRSIAFCTKRKALPTKDKNVQKQINSLSQSELHKALSSTQAEKQPGATLGNTTQSPTDLNRSFKRILKQRYEQRWRFLQEHQAEILPIDYEWFFFNNIDPSKVY